MAEREAPGAPAFRFAAPADSAALLKIYGEYLDTPITFECALPSEAEFAGRIAAVGREYPYLVCLEKGRIVGYAYAHRQAERAAYQWNAELSVYLDRSCTSRGLGRRCTAPDRHSAAAGHPHGSTAASPCPMKRVRGSTSPGLPACWAPTAALGTSAAPWRDVAWFEKPIAPYDQNPEPIRPVGDIPAEALAAILKRYEAEQP